MPEYDAKWIQSLLENSTPESTTLEFKQTLPEGADKPRKEFLKDVVGMANTRGGCIVYGIEEDASGRATHVHPLTGSRDSDVLRLQSMMADAIEPRLLAYDIQPVDFGGGYVIVLRIQPQFNKPYRTHFKDSFRFVYRDGAKNNNMTYQQIAMAFGTRGRAEEDLRNWRSARLNYLRRQLALRQLDDEAWLVMHILPLTAFLEKTTIDLHSIATAGYTFPQTSQGRSRFNLEGLYFSSTALEQRSVEYAQFFRGGQIETAWVAGNKENKPNLHIPAGTSTYRVERAALAMASRLGGLELEGPVCFALTLLNAESRSLIYRGHDGFTQQGHELYAKDAVMPEVWASAPEVLEDIHTVVRPMLDVLYQTFGVDHCNLYDENGNYQSAKQAI